MLGKYFAVVSVELVSSTVFLLPRYRLLNWIKSAYLRLFFNAKVGRSCVFYSGIWIFTGRKLVLGDDVDLARGVLLTTDGGVSIGDRTLVGYGSTIVSSNHVVPKGKGRIFSAGHSRGPVVIGADCWLGANVTVLPGVRIGEGVVIAAGSVVTKDLPSFCFAAGVPAKIIRMRD